MLTQYFELAQPLKDSEHFLLPDFIVKVPISQPLLKISNNHRTQPWFMLQLCCAGHSYNFWWGEHNLTWSTVWTSSRCSITRTCDLIFGQSLIASEFYLLLDITSKVSNSQSPLKHISICWTHRAHLKFRLQLWYLSGGESIIWPDQQLKQVQDCQNVGRVFMLAQDIGGFRIFPASQFHIEGFGQTAVGFSGILQNCYTNHELTPRSYLPENRP